MPTVKFNDKITYHKIPYYDRYNWDLIDAMRKRDTITEKWYYITNQLLNKN